MPSTSKPPRHREEVVATILYFSILGVDMEAVAELVELKFGDIVSPKECSERLKFTHSKFPKWGRPWTPAGVGKYIATFTTVDTFGTITGIDETCEKILGKQSSVSLAVLNDEYNEVKIAFGKRLESRERVAASKAAGGLICVDPSGVKSWRNNADDPVLSRETSQPWPSPSA